MIAVLGRFCSPEGIYIGYCGSYGSFSAWVWSFLGPGKDGGDYNGSCGDYGSFSVLNGPLQAVGEPVGCLQGSVTHCLALPRFLEFILLFSFSGT